MFAPWPVFHSLQAGQRTLASESSWANRASGLLHRLARVEQFQRLLLGLGHLLERGAAGQFFPGEDAVLFLFQRVQFVKQPRRLEAQRRAGLARGPDVHQAVQRVLLLLDAQFVTRRARRALAAAKAPALIKNHRLDGGKQFGRRHQADGHARAAEDGFDDFAVRVVGDDDPVLDRVAADDPAGGHFQVEDRIVGGGKLVNEFLGRRAAVPYARIAFFQNHHATALELGVVGFDGGRDDVGETHVGDEAAAFVHLQQRFPALLPFGDAHFARQHAGLHAHEREWVRSARRRRELAGGFLRA